MISSAPNWAREEVERAELGDRRRSARVATILADLGRRVGGTITGSIRDPAKREGAFRFVENLAVRAEALIQGATIACLLRVRTAFFIVALDFCFLTLRGVPSEVTGLVGSSNKPNARGLVAMTGLAMTPGGTPLGLCAQDLFVRPKKRRSRGPCRRCRAKGKYRPRRGSKRRRTCHHRVRARRKLPLQEKETRFWIKAMDWVVVHRREVGTAAKPWFQADRGADFWDLLKWGNVHREEAWITVRSNRDRRRQEGGQVLSFLRRQPVRYRTKVQIPKGEERQAREAQLEVRAARVVMTNKLWAGKVPMGVVWAHEVGPIPKGAQRLEWRLWTTHPLNRIAQVREVVQAYQRRWSIEDFHKTWKSVCGVEKTQLRSLHNLQVWITLLAMTAARIQRLLKRAREEPKAPATSELSEVEVEALCLHSSQARDAGRPMTLEVAVNAIAEMGGYTGESSGGPPGPITLGRGLEDLRVASATIGLLRCRGDPEM
jgi:hypothetical protein